MQLNFHLSKTATIKNNGLSLYWLMCFLECFVLSSSSRFQSKDACQFLLVAVDTFVSSVLVYWQRSLLTQEKGEAKAGTACSEYWTHCHASYAPLRKIKGQRDSQKDAKTDTDRLYLWLIARKSFSLAPKNFLPARLFYLRHFPPKRHLPVWQATDRIH